MFTKRRVQLLGVSLAVVIALVVGLVHFDVLDRFKSNKEQQYHSLGGGVAEQKNGPKLKATPATVKGKMPFAWAVKPLGTTVHITPDGDLPKPVTLRFTLSTPVKGADKSNVLIASSESGEAKDWIVRKPDQVSADGKYAYITTSKLSWWQPVLRASEEVLNAFKAEMRKGFDALTGDATTVSEPAKCEGESTAAAKGYSVKSQGDSLHWCLGWKNNTPYLKEINNRRYALQIQHPGLDSKYLQNTSLDLSELARLGNGKWTILSPFDGAEFNLKKLPAGTKAEFGGEANALYQLQFGVETLINIMTRFGAGGGTIKNGAITLSNADRVAEITSKFLAVKDCGAQIFNPQNVSFGSLLSNCFDPATLGDIFGWRGVLVGAVMVVGPLVEFFRSQFDALGDMLNGHDKHTLIVSYTKPNPLKGFISDKWGRHLSSIKIKSDGTGHLMIDSGAGGVEGCGTGDGYCGFQGDFKATVNKDGSLNATYTKIWYTFNGDQVVPMPPSFDTTMPKVGDSVTIKKFFDHTLLVQQQGDLAVNDMDIDVRGGHYRGYVWCGPDSGKINNEITTYCGA